MVKIIPTGRPIIRPPSPQERAASKKAKVISPGLAPMLFRSFAVEPLSDSSPSQKLTDTFHLSTTYLLIIPISVCVWFFFRYLSRKKATGITQRSAVLILLSTFVFIDLLYNICFWDNWISIYRVGFFRFFW